MSSFGATLSETENVSTFNEIEVESPLLGGNVLTLAFDVYNGHPFKVWSYLEINEFKIMIYHTSLRMFIAMEYDCEYFALS